MKNNSGQSLFEVVLAIAIVTLITVGIIILSTTSIRNASYSKNKTLASRYSQELVEWLRKEREENLTTFIGHATGTYCFDSLSWSNASPCGSGEMISGTNITREATLSTTLYSLKNFVQATVVVSWQDAQGYHEVRNVINLGDTRDQ